jgi:hypothetical protein
MTGKSMNDAERDFVFSDPFKCVGADGFNLVSPRIVFDVYGYDLKATASPRCPLNDFTSDESSRHKYPMHLRCEA